MEYWDVYNIDREKTGRIVGRNSTNDWLKENEYHLGIHVCIFNSKKEMLIQQRTLTKKADPGKWDFAGRGSVLQGETARDGARRELLEELGIDYDFSNKISEFTINSENLFDDYFYIMMDINVEDLVLQEEEVAAAKWATQEEILKMVDDGQFAITNREFMMFIFKKLSLMKGD